MNKNEISSGTKTMFKKLNIQCIFFAILGVLWDLIGHIIEKSPDGILALRKLGKKLYFITNNSMAPIDLYLQRMKAFEIVKEEVIR